VEARNLSADLDESEEINGKVDHEDVIWFLMHL